MKQVDVSGDGATVSLGPGNRWAEVYNIIQPKGLAVSGGRWGNVGVGGYLLGGKSGLWSLIFDQPDADNDNPLNQ
jgi:FAD/FMN-containing dehydrogenase